MNVLEMFGKLGPIGGTVFVGVLLGGVALSFFWKNFGPWQQLSEAQALNTEAKAQLEQCQRDCEARDLQAARVQAEMADLRARYSLLMEALTRSGVAMVIDRDPNHK